MRLGFTLFATTILCVSFLILSTRALADGPVWGPIVTETDLAHRSEHRKETDVISPTTDVITGDALGEIGAEAAAPKKEAATIAEMLDEALGNEFKTEEAAEQNKITSKQFNETLAKGTVEYVVKVSNKPRRRTEPGVDGAAGNVTTGVSAVLDGAASGADTAAGQSTLISEQPVQDPVEQDVDRLIDAEENEYVLSRPRTGVTLTLDPVLLQDLTIVLTASSLFGCAFEAIRQPVINGYILAGSVVGPGGFALVKELVQIESLAQVGVQLLLFGLGMEFSVDKMRAVGAVAIVGGFIQILLFIIVAAVGAVAIGGALSEGIFVGALVSMSSTSVVIKALGPHTRSAAAQIVIGTLILQDCSVGLMFALLPVLSSLNDPKTGVSGEATSAIVLLIAKVLFKLASILGGSFLLSRTLLPPLVNTAARRCSAELFQLSIIAYCMACAWFCSHMGLSHELGAFIAGIMISRVEQHEAVLTATEQVRNVFTGLFLASIGLIISPVFLLEHVRILSAGALTVLLIKASLITLVVWNFKYSLNTSFAVGISLAQVGEFAFVLLSLATQLSLVNNRLAMLLLGTTAVSLMMTPMVLRLSHTYIDFGGPPQLPCVEGALKSAQRHRPPPRASPSSPRSVQADKRPVVHAVPVRLAPPAKFG